MFLVLVPLAVQLSKTQIQTRNWATKGTETDLLMWDMKLEVAGIMWMHFRSFRRNTLQFYSKFAAQ